MIELDGKPSVNAQELYQQRDSLRDQGVNVAIVQHFNKTYGQESVVCYWKNVLTTLVLVRTD